VPALQRRPRLAPRAAACGRANPAILRATRAATPDTAKEQPLPATRRTARAPTAEPPPEPASAPAAAAEALAADRPLPPEARRGRGLLNLTDLADRHGSDKGSGKHRYTELYHMLFQPLRRRRIAFLEMGLQIGGPEHGSGADRATTDLPSVRMWLDYFPNARIFGLDVSDFGWFAHDRFRFLRCDMDDPAALAAAAAALPPLDVALDDASHASHHQQQAFLTLFPRLVSGGLYVIEDLRWQPAAYERPGITKTAELFQSYLQGGVFAHSDPATAAAFNALRADISGCFLFQVRWDKTRRDQVAVIHKR
jgi:hypothetical protein